MTTDPFIEAARTEAERQVPAFTSTDYTKGGLTAITRLAHVKGWEAARNHLAAQEPTDAEKDAAMDSLGCELRVVENGQSTCELHGGYATNDDVCEVVEVALSAARAARRDEEKRDD